MPSFEYFATLDDSVEILRDLCQQKFRVIAEPGPLSEPKAPCFDQVTDELVDILLAAPNFYLAGAFTRFPVAYRQYKAGEAAGRFGVNLLVQGPLMQCLAGRLKTVEGHATLLPGDVSYQDAYRIPETNQWEKASPELKAAYRQAVTTIKRHCGRYRSGVDAFVAPRALALLEHGEARLKGAPGKAPGAASGTA